MSCFERMKAIREVAHCIAFVEKYMYFISYEKNLTSLIEKHPTDN